MNLSIVIDGLKSEISAYLAAAEDVSTKIHPIQGRIQESEIGGLLATPIYNGCGCGRGCSCFTTSGSKVSFTLESTEFFKVYI